MSEIWKGKAEPLDEEAFERAGHAHRVDPRRIQAVWVVETGRSEYRRDLSLSRRHEPHHMPKDHWAEIGFFVPAGEASWRASLGLSFRQRETIFDRSVALDLEKACDASSWAGPQMMGFNAETCGFASAVSMVEAMADSSQVQLDAMMKFIEANSLTTHLRSGDFVRFASGYNGTGQARVYARRIRQEVESATGIPAMPVLRLGENGAWVARLQVVLGVTVDGVFGNETREAVVAFQAERGLVADGIVGALTWAALGEAMPTEPAPSIDLQEKISEILDRESKDALASIMEAVAA